MQVLPVALAVRMLRGEHLVCETVEAVAKFPIRLLLDKGSLQQSAFPAWVTNCFNERSKGMLVRVLYVCAVVVLLIIGCSRTCFP